MAQPRIVMREVSALKPYENNPRTHSSFQIDQIARSITEFGFLIPILIDDDDQIIAGHGRCLAAQQLDLEKVPCIQAKHLTEIQKKAYVIADNKLTLNADWELTLLTDELKALEASADIDALLTGFNDAELSELFNDTVNDEIDYGEHWQGMPDFQQNDEKGFRVITIHFKDQESVDDFAKRLDLELGEKTRATWFPPIDREKTIDKSWNSES